MSNNVLIGAAPVGWLALPAHAQTREPGVPPGVGACAATGAVGSAIVGGPVGAVVGGAAGAVFGGIAEATRPRFREHVVARRHTSLDHDGEVLVGRQLPWRVTDHQVARDDGATEYRYRVVHGRTS